MMEQEQDNAELLNTRNQGLTAEPDSQLKEGPFASLLKLEIWVPFVGVTFVLLLFYIFNQHHAVKALKKKEQLKSSIKELRAEYISIKSDLMVRSKQSEIAEKLKETGLKSLRKPPIKLEKPIKNGK
jgi:hypothetical protein